MKAWISIGREITIYRYYKNIEKFEISQVK